MWSIIVLNMSCNLLNTENEKQNGCMCTEWLQMFISCWHPWPRRWLGVAQRVSPHSTVSSLGKDQNSKFEVWSLLSTYQICTIIKSKNPKLNHCKLGNIYSYTPFLSLSYCILCTIVREECYTSLRTGLENNSLLHQAVNPPCLWW